MEWWQFLLMFFGCFLFLLFLGVPVSFAFLVINCVSVILIIGLQGGMNQLILSAYDAVTQFALTPIPLFILMGSLLYHSGMAIKTLDALSVILGKLPGRLSVLSVVAGTLFATMSGSNIANTSMLGSVLLPSMRERGYHKSIAIGPIMASGTLAMIIPPSAVAVMLGSIGKISVGDLLIGGIVPGIAMAVLFLVYILVRCSLNPELAPAYEVNNISGQGRLRILLVQIVPLLLIIVVVLGSIFSGIATPSESAALGALATFLLLLCYGTVNRTMLKKAFSATLEVSGMLMLIVATSATFSQMLSFTGATRELVEVVTSWSLSGYAIIAIMLVLILIMGMFLEQVSIMMITLPLFVPIVILLEFDPVWFGIMYLICLDLGNLTPPVGMNLFIMKSVAPRDITLTDISKSAIPFILLELLVVLIIFMFPQVVLWLPNLYS